MKAQDHFESVLVDLNTPMNYDELKEILEDS
jgi:hypothetical protein